MYTSLDIVWFVGTFTASCYILGVYINITSLGRVKQYKLLESYSFWKKCGLSILCPEHRDNTSVIKVLA